VSPTASIERLVGLDGKVALVTGGGGGIGSAVVALLREAGARVLSVDLPGAPCVEGARRFDCDVGKPDDVAGLFEAVRREVDSLDLLVHCAGITRDRVIWKLRPEDWDDVLRVNLDSAFLLLREAVPLMRGAGEGAVVLVSSINGERGKFGQSNYAASKAGLIGLGRTAARELGRFGIRVNVVAPGMIETAMTESLGEEMKRQAVEETVLGRIGRPEDVARAVLFLLSGMGRHVTGQVLRVDGGQLMA
jgi:acetoacetyl-CoA reductase/3-oxoacyl-[acyl-carrier protein] reductase